MAPVLDIQDLSTHIKLTSSVVQAVGNIDLHVEAGETLGIVGESGCGKSMTGLSIMGLLPPGGSIVGGSIKLNDRELVGLKDEEMRRVRGNEISMIFQDPLTSLDPTKTIGYQVSEPVRLHRGASKAAALHRAVEVLSLVGLPRPKERLSDYPHQLSGGQQQRVMIAMALACEPRLLIADEPTTALDVTVQRQILELLARLKEKHRMGLLFISHDLGVVGEIADHVVVMRQGTVREQGPVERVFSAPQDAYTRALLACRPTLEQRAPRLQVVDDHIAGHAPRHETARVKDPDAPVIVEAESLSKSFWVRKGVFGRTEFEAVKNASFRLRKGHTLGIVGESGSGKTTLGLALLRLHEPSGGPVRGRVIFDGRDLLALPRAALLPLRRRIQVVFQNPYASLNPRFTVGQTLVEPMTIHGIGADAAQREQRARALLGKVGLADDALGKYPHEFSGGQRQRIAIARCLTLDPE